MSTALVSGVKISALGPATTPLAGDEEVPIVQDGVTRRAAASAFGGSPAAAVVWTAMVTAALAAGANNNLSPAGLDATARLGLTPVDDTSELRGLEAGTDGQLLMILNHSTANLFTIVNESGTSTAANRFAINGDIIIPARCGALFMYDGTIDRWVKA